MALLDLLHSTSHRSPTEGLSLGQRWLKRGFDLCLSLLLLVLAWPVILTCLLVARLDTGASGLFLQERVGLGGRTFRVAKIRTMRPVGGPTVTTLHDPRITRVGLILRRSKLDELPQLFNVLCGQMSFVGPRPDVPGFVDALGEEGRIILSVRPGITGPATLKYRDEETLLAGVEDPERFNREVIFPDKVRLNCTYIRQWSFYGDLLYLWRTLLPGRDGAGR